MICDPRISHAPTLLGCFQKCFAGPLIRKAALGVFISASRKSLIQEHLELEEILVMLFYYGGASLADLLYRERTLPFMLIFEYGAEKGENGGAHHGEVVQRFKIFREIERLFGVGIVLAFSGATKEHWRPLYGEDGGWIFYREVPTRIPGLDMGIFFKEVPDCFTEKNGLSSRVAAFGLWSVRILSEPCARATERKRKGALVICGHSAPPAIVRRGFVSMLY